jgi:CBS domain-containing protein
VSPIRQTDPVGDLISPAVATIHATATLQEAVEAMAADRLGLLVVMNASGMVGVLSERDVIAALADGADLEQERVRDHASDRVVTVEADLSVAEAARSMADAEIRHLAVARDGDVIGVVSVRDLLVALAADLG